jgi:hypothetical protein
MKSPYVRPQTVTPTGIATGAILLVTLVMAASLLFDQPAANPSGSTTIVQTAAHAKG